MFVIHEHAIHPIKEAIHMFILLTIVYDEHAIHPNKGSHTYVYSLTISV